METNLNNEKSIIYKKLQKIDKYNIKLSYPYYVFDSFEELNTILEQWLSNHQYMNPIVVIADDIYTKCYGFYAQAQDPINKTQYSKTFRVLYSNINKSNRKEFKDLRNKYY